MPPAFFPCVSRQDGLQACGEPANRTRMADAREAAGRLDLSGRLVLVVEDNESCAEAVSDWLASCGALVETADCVQGALERVRAASPDVALIDICLPDGSGWDWVDRIRIGTRGGK